MGCGEVERIVKGKHLTWPSFSVFVKGNAKTDIFVDQYLT